MGAGDGGFRIAELGPSEVQLPLRDRLDLDQGFGALQRRALDLAVGFGLAKGGLLREVLADELTKLDVVVGE